MDTTCATPEDRAKLAKLLGLLGSDHGGERDAAGLAAHRYLRARGLTWEGVLGQAPAPYQQMTTRQAPEPASSPHLMVEWCIARGGFLSQWERNFLHSLVQYGYCARLTRKQQSVVDDITRKIHVQMRGEVAA